VSSQLPGRAPSGQLELKEHNVVGLSGSE
jgi:hypothetical protein